jgi:hypothetical protein
MYINLFHILFVAPFLFYIAYNRENTDPKAFDVLMMVSVAVFVYHAMRYYKLSQLQKE